MRRRAGNRAREAPDLCSSQVPLRSLHHGEQAIPEAVSSSEQGSHQSFPGALCGQVEGIRGRAPRHTLRVLRLWMPMRRVQGGKHRLRSPTPREHGWGMRLPFPAQRLNLDPVDYGSDDFFYIYGAGSSGAKPGARPPPILIRLEAALHTSLRCGEAHEGERQTTDSA